MTTPSSTLVWIATRMGMACRITTADLLARIDLGAEQVNEDTFVWEGWVIRRHVDVSSWTWGIGHAILTE